jgi:Cu/Ag efflux pump CusA
VAPLVIATGAGAGARRALGTAVLSGMLAATLLAVFIVPVLYVVVNRIASRQRTVTQVRADAEPVHAGGGD